jgi:hypothetical protein
MKIHALIFLAVATCTSCTRTTVTVTQSSPINGTWRMFAAKMIKGKDTTITFPVEGQEMIKILNNTHFAFFKHDLQHGKDSTKAVYDTGSGTYTLDGETYTEHLTYCNYREWEDKDFTFNLQVKKDTLIQKGIEKIEGLQVNQEIIEMYVRVP